MNYRNWTVAELLDMEGSGVSHGPAVLLQSEGEKGGSGEGRSPWLSGAAGEGRRGVVDGGAYQVGDGGAAPLRGR